MRQSTPRSSFRLGPDARVGLLLACNESRSHGLHSRVNAPGLPLRFQPAASTTRSALRSTTDLRFAPVSTASMLWPVAASTTSLACRLSDLHSPSGFLHPSGSKRSTGPAASWPAFRNCPIPVRSPQPLSITKFPATDQRSRVATASEARCSSNLLEPLPICSRSRFSSIPRVKKT
jgi:hypothetical protein